MLLSHDNIEKKEMVKVCYCRRREAPNGFPTVIMSQLQTAPLSSRQ